MMEPLFIVFWILIAAGAVFFTGLVGWGLWVTRHVPLTERSRKWLIFRWRIG
jgi:hypothetical protein